MRSENWGEKELKDATNHVGFGILERIHMTRDADEVRARNISIKRQSEVIVADDACALRAQEDGPAIYANVTIVLNWENRLISMTRHILEMLTSWPPLAKQTSSLASPLAEPAEPTEPSSLADSMAPVEIGALTAKAARGAMPPVDLRELCLVRGMTTTGSDNRERTKGKTL